MTFRIMNRMYRNVDHSGMRSEMCQGSLVLVCQALEYNHGSEKAQ
jgi:hypothetical protein